MNMRYADAHLHLTDPASKGIDDDAELVFSCTASPEEWGALSDMRDDRVVRFYGTHPWYAAKTDLKGLEDILERDDKACVGEIGLDSKRGQLSEQVGSFKAQLALSNKYDRIANIHMIGCESEMLRILRESRCTCILHSFSGPESYIRPFAECGCYFSVSPRIHNKSKDRIASLLSSIPEDRLLIETDAPNNRFEMREHVLKLSEIMSVDGDELIRVTLKNARSLIP